MGLPADTAAGLTLPQRLVIIRPLAQPGGLPVLCTEVSLMFKSVPPSKHAFLCRAGAAPRIFGNMFGICVMAVAPQGSWRHKREGSGKIGVGGLGSGHEDSHRHLAEATLRTGDGEPVEHEGEDNADRPETNDQAKDRACTILPGLINAGHGQGATRQPPDKAVRLTEAARLPSRIDSI
jgi:hypothetical protein